MKPFYETKLAQFLKEKAPDVFSVVVDVAGNYFPPVKILRSLIGSSKTVSEKGIGIEVESKILEYELGELKEHLANTANARNREIQINNSPTASWLSKNTASIIALSYTAFTFVLYILVLGHQISATENITFLVINSVTNIAMLVVGYYFGSSAGGKENAEVMRKMAQSE